MLWSYSGLLLAYITSMVLAQPNKTQTCLKPRNKTVYTCEENQMIHVISQLYQEASEDCEVPDDACEVTEDTLNNGLTTGCNGKVICTEDLSLLKINKTCENITAAITTTSYECISDPPVNVCSTVVPSLGPHTLYLTSPNFPEESNAGNRDRACECDITGTDMSVEILEIKFVIDYRANLTLTGDISSWESYPNIFLMYNQKVISETNSLHVMFNANNRKSQLMWIRIKGTSNTTTTCNHVASPATSPLPIASASTSVAITSGTPIKSNESNTVAVVVSCVFAALVVAVIIIVAIVIMMRRKRFKPYLTSQNDEGSIKHIEALHTSSASQEKSDNEMSGNDHGADYADVEPLGTTKTDTGHTTALDSKSSRTSRGPQSSHYAEITPLCTTETGNRDHQPTPHYYISEPMVTAKTYVGHSSSLSRASRGPAGSEYSEPDTLGISKTDAVQKTSRERVSGDLSTPNKSSLAFASEMFRSTRDKGETEEKTNAKESKNKRISDTSAEGKSNNAYHDGNEKTHDKHESKTKDRRSRSKSNPDYQETGNVSVSQHDKEVSSTVSHKAGGILNELGTAKGTRNQESSLSSKSKISNKKQKERSCADDTDSDDKLVMVPHVLYEGTGRHFQSRTGANSKVPSGKGTNTLADDSDDKPIMVPNVLYEGTGADLNTRNGVLDSTHGKSSHQVPQGSEYEDIKDDRTSSRPLVICDTPAGGPSTYEEIVI